MSERSHVGRAFGALSGRPEGVWPGGILHHGARFAILIVVAFVVQFLFPVAPVQDFPVLEEGMVADEDIIAQVTFPIYKDQEELSRERAEAAAAVAPIFDYTPSALDSMLARVDAFMARLDSAATQGGAPLNERAAIGELLRSYSLPRGEALLDVLRMRTHRDVLGAALRAAIRRELPRGIAQAGDLEGSASQIDVRREGLHRLVPRDSVLTAPGFFARAADHLPRQAVPELTEFQRLVLVRFFEPSLTLNVEATEAARERARQAVAPVKADVIKGEKIVGANERIRETELERLRAYREHLVRIDALESNGGGGLRSVGAWLYDFFVLLVFGLLLFFYRPAVYDNFRHVTLITGLVLALVGAAAVVARTDAPVELIPIAFPVLVVAALWDGRLALNLALILSILLGGQTPFLGISVLFTFVLSGAAAALCVRAVRRRAETWVFVSIIAGAYAVAAVALGLLRSREAPEILWSVGWGTLNAVASALFAMGFLPLFEAFSRITTDQSLLELADLNRPLLQRLSREAPGTFAHTINVANLAEAAARAIGADALLARVGIYYHDVGKIAKPQYFIENQPQGRNPHDKLKPGTSAAIIRNHVLEGLRLADEYKLPGCVKAFIAEHHGTQPIGFFMDRARELDAEAEIDPRDFVYPGPRPQSRETAIAMLADSVESATRVLQDPTPDRIAALVDRIVATKVQLGQLDDTPLTMRELTRCKEAFTSVLTGMYHHRIDYPQTREPAATGAAADER